MVHNQLGGLVHKLLAAIFLWYGLLWCIHDSWLNGLQMVDGQSHVFLVELIHEPRTIKGQQHQCDIDAPHPPRVPPGLSDGDNQCLRINHGAVGATDTLQGEQMLARLHVYKADILLIGGQTPFAVSYLIAIGNIEVVAHVDALELNLKRTLVV